MGDDASPAAPPDGAGANGSEPANSHAIEPGVLVDYLQTIAQVTLGATPGDLKDDGSFLNPQLLKDTQERCQYFANASSNVLYIHKVAKSRDEDPATDGGLDKIVVHHLTFAYKLTMEMESSKDVFASLVFLKGPGIITPDRPVQSQVFITNLPGQAVVDAAKGRKSAAFEIMHSHIHNALVPFFDANTQQPNDESERAAIDIKTGIPATRKSLKDLEVNLMNLNKGMRVFLSVHPRVVDAVKRGAAPETEMALHDSKLLNALQAQVSGWLRDIRAVTAEVMDETSTNSSQELSFAASDEINYWLSMEATLSSIEEQMRRPEIAFTLKILSVNKRLGPAWSFTSDTGVKEAMDRVLNYNNLMRDFPLRDLLHAMSLKDVQTALGRIFTHLTKKLRVCSYPVRRALPLVVAITADLDATLRRLVPGTELANLDYKDFKDRMAQCAEIFKAFEDYAKEFTNVAREATRRRAERFIPLKINKKHADLEGRLKYLNSFRDDHEQLRQTIDNVLRGAVIEAIGDTDPVREVELAWQELRGVDLLGATEQGRTRWVRAEEKYNERTTRVENAIISQLRDQLVKASSANEMFRIFSKFNALLVRPKIRNAIVGYQTQLMTYVKEAIQGLQQRAKVQYVRSDAHRMSQLRDLQRVSGGIVWTLQIEHKLDEYMQKVQDVLGENWKLQIDGQEVYLMAENFKKILRVHHSFERWRHEMQGPNKPTIGGPLFRIEYAISAWKLDVDFDEHAITLFKETRNLLWQNFSVPHAIQNVATDAKRVYPYAIGLKESVRTLTQTLEHIGAMEETERVLLASSRNQVVDQIRNGISLRWEFFVSKPESFMESRDRSESSTATGESPHGRWTRTFFSTVSELHSRTWTLKERSRTASQALSDLNNCQYDAQAFGDRLRAIQDVVDDLRGRHFVNLNVWVSDLNTKIRSILQARLRQAIQQWVEAFEQDAPTSEHRKMVNGPRAEQVHELNQVNQAIYLDPPLESAREQWHLQLHEWVAVICDLEKLQADVYEQRSASDDRATRFDDLTGSCAAGLLAGAYSSIDRKLRDVDGYVGKWLGFQSLWALDMNLVEREMEPAGRGDLMDKRLENWSNLLHDIRKNRQTFDTNDTSHSFGHIVIDYDQVHIKISRMYDDLQRQIRDRFATILKENMAEVHDAIEGARTRLERITVNHFGSATKEEVVPFVQVILDCEEKKTEWEKLIGIFKHGETLLLTLRWRFDPNTWTVRYSQMDDSWRAFDEQLKRRRAKLDENADMIKEIVARSGAEITGEIERLRVKWDSDRELESGDETSMLNEYSDSLKRLRNEMTMLHTAQKALKLECTDTEWLEQLEEQVTERQQLSGALSPFRTKIIALRKTRWLDVQPTAIRQELRQQKSGMNQLASKWRGYKTFQELLRKIDEYRTTLNETSVIVALRSDAVNDHHWDEVFKRTNRTRPKDLTLGDVWELPLQAADKAIRDIIARAQGEYALKKYLVEDKERWNTYELDLTTSSKGTRLIRGWDDLLEQLQDSINGLQAMHHSPHMTKEMRTETQTWESRLDRIYKILHPWMDVQRQYVYLEGVFKGNAEIHVLLPGEANRFARNEKAFTSLMNRVTASPKVDVVLDIEGCDKEIDTLQKSLNRLQKALGEYLEKERMSFPRFYFVGDEDLLEMIGNSSDVTRISKHFQKMFAGISGIVIKEDGTISGFESREAETVYLRKEISLAKTPRINDWLTLLEQGMKSTLAELLAEAIDAFGPLFARDTLTVDALTRFMEAFPSQIVVLATQAVWTAAVEEGLKAGGKVLGQLLDLEAQLLRLLADMVLGDIADLQRKKCEQLITECVHQRDVIEKLANANATSQGHHLWLLQMRYVYTPDGDFLQRLQVKMANASLNYGFEYLGVPDRLVRTPLTDRCFLTLTQGLCQRLGGSPYGPAGTGKTESVKALGLQLGRFTLVFCCDDTFDFVAMGRIFLGICQVGAWGCFDEFNRLEERILSAVSQQIQNIQIGLKQGVADNTYRIELAGRQLRVNDNTGIFITMNPGYAGRSNLPDNLKKLFRSVAMSKPDKELIAEVMLYSQGFTQAKHLSKQTVPFFDQCARRLSKQAHYDFGLRALKSVLVSSGGLKRARLRSNEGATGDEQIVEPQILVQSIRETIAPKLIQSDVDMMEDIERESFPGVDYVPADMRALEDAIRTLAEQRHLVVSENWLKKILQLYQIQKINHGVMMVGDSGTGKSAAWRLLLDAMHVAEGRKGVSDIIDSKVMSKEALYGKLDSTTREWTDGLFTAILRKIVNNFQNEQSKTHWIVFDGDVDPEWVENLNSVLDDNKLLTLPNGERLGLPPNVRIMFEVENLKYATLATVSRCGMVWFSEDTVSPMMLVRNYLGSLRSKPFRDVTSKTQAAISADNVLAVQAAVANYLDTSLTDNFITEALAHAERYNHIMDFSASRALMTLFSLLNKAVRDIIEHNVDTGLPLKDELMDDYMSKKLTLAVVWALTGDCPLGDRNAFGNQLRGLPGISSPPTDETNSAIDFKVRELPQTEWESWQAKVPRTEMMPDAIIKGDVVVPTVDTLRHEDVLYSWLAEHKPLVLCGPPGSGKTMTLFAALRKLSSLDPIGLNFSSSTTPELLIQTLEQNCELKTVNQKQVLAPKQLGRWIVIFCDEINLPAPDKYGTQRAISFLRQLVEQNGFWRTADKVWITLERIQFVGACNPPTDAGRTPLGARFLRHAPLIMVDYPGELSLKQIYGAYNDAALKVAPSLRGFAQPLTDAMVRFYLESQQRFTPQIQPHYIYSPRELTRWVRGVFEAIKPAENEGAFGVVPVGLDRLVRIWAHEALRLFRDRLVQDEERQWTDDAVKRVAEQFFEGINHHDALSYPILFSDWLTKAYEPVEQDKLRDYVQNRLRQFGDEVMDVPLVPFDDVLEHALRIARVFRQPQGHLILIGVSGSGKTTLARLVSWMEGMTVYQIKVSRKYTGAHFDMDLRNVLRLCGSEDRRTCFILDEANVLDSGFLERMNTLLANAEIPGLFEGDELTSLLTSCRDAAKASTPPLDLETEEEVFRWFRNRIIKNLHVVFTMNPPEGGLASRAAASPALFNRCVLNWMGDWSSQTFFQVGSALTNSVDLVNPEFEALDTMPVMSASMRFPPSFKEAIINAMVYMHDSLRKFNAKLLKQQDKITFLTPRHFLDFVKHFEKLSAEKRNDLQEQQLHLNVGVDKLNQTFNQVRELRTMLDKKKKQLEIKQAEADAKLAELTDQKSAAKQNQEEGEKLKVEIEERRRNIAIQKAQVEEELEEAEPAVEEAKNSVSSIKRQHLGELRTMKAPPVGIRKTMEAVCMLLGRNVKEWKDVCAVMRGDDFIVSIVAFDQQQNLTKALRTKLRNEFLELPEYSYEKIEFASKACGPLVKWLNAQVNYAEILEKIGPLRHKVAALEVESEKSEQKAADNKAKLEALEVRIETYNREFASLVREVEGIKTEMQTVEAKVSRSEQLLRNLSSEKSRWGESRESFEEQKKTLVGDTLVAAAFLAYGGLYDQTFRKSMMDDWLHHLSLSGVRYQTSNPITEYLSTAQDRMKWQARSLPVDDLCTENAIVLKRYNRYPLIIDPSGQITTFLEKECLANERRLTVTSFLDDGFDKKVETAMRFGLPILIQDAEHMDPMLNPVLNREYERTGGRILVQVGASQIDYSDKFDLYLMTRDPSVTFPPDVCSRMTFVNFTVTQSSLQMQSLSHVLKAERPDVDQQRSDLTRAQGEFKVELRGLEEELLRALSESQGNILDNDAVLKSLEDLKEKARVVAEKMSNAEGIMAIVEQKTQGYRVVARSCSAVFSVLEQLHYLNHFYQFSLQYFLDIFHSVLDENKKLASPVRGDASDEKIYDQRRDRIVRNLFVTTFTRTAPGLLQKDRITLAILLAQASPYKMDRGLIDVILSKFVEGADVSSQPGGAARREAFARAARIDAIREKVDGVPEADWDTFLSEEFAENFVPRIWDDSAEPRDQALLRLLLVKLFRLDRFVPAAEQFATVVFGPGLLDVADDLQHLLGQVSPSQPIALVSTPGFDASYKVDHLVQRVGAVCKNIAMGSNESVASANQALSSAAQTGSWVLIKNVHLAPAWLQALEKNMQGLTPHPQFRLFLSMESSPKIPINLLRASRVLMYEQPAGIRANMKDSMSSLATRAVKAPVERARVYLLLCFLHAVVQERLRYAPTLGWKGFWEFNDSDYECSAFIIDRWIESVANTRTNIGPAEIPWAMIRSLVTEMYGGKIDSESDFGVLRGLVEATMTPAAYDVNHKLVEGDDDESSLVVPSGTTLADFNAWVHGLPEREPPTFLGLPANAEKLLLVDMGKNLVGDLRRVVELLDEGEQVMAEA